MNKIAKPLKWNTLEDAAAYLAALTGEEWTIRRVLEAGEKGHLTINAVLPTGTRLRAGNKPAYSGDTVKLDSHHLGGLLKHESVYVDYTHDTNQYSKSPRAVDLELRPSAMFTAVHLRVADTALEEFSKTVSLQHVPCAVTRPASDTAMLLPVNAQPSFQSVPNKPLARRLSQELEILRAIRGFGHDPEAFPKNQPGKPGVKSQVRKALSHYTHSIFRGAWERLRSDGRIKDA